MSKHSSFEDALKEYLELASTLPQDKCKEEIERGKQELEKEFSKMKISSEDLKSIQDP